jgi:hypothetical protein
MLREAERLRPSGNVDSLELMEQAMTFVHSLILEEKMKGAKADNTKILGYFDKAYRFAEGIAPYRHPRLSMVKVAGEHQLGGTVRFDGRQTAAELRAEIIADLGRLGIFETVRSPAAKKTIISEPHG